MIARVLSLILIATVLTAGYAQSSSPQITKARALRDVRVLSLPGWSEVLSDENKFRILFPGKAQIDDDVISMKGFTLTKGSGHWSVFCADLGVSIPNEESALRKAYQQSIDSMTRNKTYLLASEDVSLNGRLGIQFRIRGLSRTSYTRAFAFGRKLYTISVSQKKTADQTADQNADPPPDVQQFFDSFAYWD